MLEVHLPDTMSNFFDARGYSATTHDEHRSLARIQVRVASELTVVYVPPFARATTDPMRVLVKDLSKRGICVLSPCQMWPTQAFLVELMGRCIQARVVRCRRLDSQCFEVGAVIVSLEGTDDSEDEAE